MELMIAVTIFAVVALSLYSLFAGRIKIWEKQESAFKSGHSARLVLDNMAKELRNSILYSRPEGALTELQEDLDLEFIGDEKRLTFITVLGKKIARVEYFFENTLDRNGVLKRNIVFQEEGFGKEHQKEGICLDGLENLGLEYAQKGEKDSDPVWQETWTKPAAGAKFKIPAGVRVTLEFRGLAHGKNEIIKKTIFIPTGGAAN